MAYIPLLSVNPDLSSTLSSAISTRGKPRVKVDDEVVRLIITDPGIYKDQHEAVIHVEYNAPIKKDRKSTSFVVRGLIEVLKTQSKTKLGFPAIPVKGTSQTRKMEATSRKKLQYMCRWNKKVILTFISNWSPIAYDDRDKVRPRAIPLF